MLTRSSRINKDDEADYQRLADANEGQRSPGGSTQQAVRALVHRSCINILYCLKDLIFFLIINLKFSHILFIGFFLFIFYSENIF